MIDTFLARFCRARKWDLTEIKKMFAKYAKYRDDNGIDTIIGEQVLTKDQINKLYSFHQKGYNGVDKVGRPIYIEMSGQMQPERVFEFMRETFVDRDEAMLLRSFMKDYETVNKLAYYSCSLLAKKQISHTFLIMDMTGLSFSMFNSRVKHFVKLGSQITQDYYPEQMGKLMIVNSPWYFQSIWAICKGFIDEGTR